MDAQDGMFEVARAQLLALDLPGLRAEDILPDSSLVDDLGLDSLKFVDLTVGLEEALGIEEFPMQEWVDQQVEAGLDLTVGGLAMACLQVMQGSAEEGANAPGSHD